MNRFLNYTMIAVVVTTGCFAAQPMLDVDTSTVLSTHHVPGNPTKSKILFSGMVDTVTNKDGIKTLAKDWNDFTGYIPINSRSDSGYVMVNHEMIIRDSLLGDGGGMTVFTAYKKDNEWYVADHPKGKFRNVDFTGVGLTLANCGGLQTPWGTILTAEEWMRTNNMSVALDAGIPGLKDTSDFTITQFNGTTISKTVPRYKNFNWMVEVDPVQAKAIRKNYNMGRYDHEGGFAMDDKKTVYLSDDATPGVFFKFVSDSAGSYVKGNLYAYKQSQDGNSGEWLALPMDIDSMLLARDVAIKRGATMFTRLEWVEGIGGKIYMSETGRDKSAAHYQTQRSLGGTIAKHLRDRMPAGTGVTLYTDEVKSDSNITDYYGRVLRFDPTTNKMDVLVEGGAGTKGMHLSNPDGLASTTLNGKNYLLILEDLNGVNQGRNPAYANGKTLCEAYLLDLSIAHPVVDSLHRIFITPMGAEVTGARFTPDGKTLFLNVQHPDTANPSPYRTSYTVAIYGYADGSTPIFQKKSDLNQKDTGTLLRVDPFSRYVYFNQKVDAVIYNTQGIQLQSINHSDVMDIAFLNKGQYFIKIGSKDLHKIILH